MEKNKYYYWFKLKDDFFAQPYIKKLRKIAGGDTYVIIYQKILLLTVKTNGYLYFQGIEKTLEEELALILDEEIDNVKITVLFMKSNNLLESTSEDKKEYLLPNMLSLTGSESESAERVRAYRERKKQGFLLISQNEKALHCNGDVTKCNENVTTDIDIDKDKDKEVFNNKSINNKKNIGIKRHIVGHSPDAASQGILNPELLPVKITIYDEIINYLNQKCGSKYKSNTPATMSAIKSRIKEGFKLDDFKEVIDKKTEEWINNPKMCLYLRPTTLFGTKFESYLNQKIINKNASQRTIKNFIVNQEVKKDIEGGIL